PSRHEAGNEPIVLLRAGNLSFEQQENPAVKLQRLYIPEAAFPEELFKKVEEQNLYLLLPFYLLLYRQEIKSPSKYGRSREDLVREVAGLVQEAEGILERGFERGALTETDVVLVLERIEQMHTELYGTYKEFQEEQMRLQERLKSKVKAAMNQAAKAQEMQFESKAKAQEMQFESKMKTAVNQTENKILGLFKQGYSLEEVEKLLAQEAGTQTGTTVSQ
ncbi:hypothetical protein ACYULU_15430, partial [Breznakiellaceae bacterium SP9]